MTKKKAIVVQATDQLILERTLLGAIASLVPIPLLDDALLRRSRHALLRELASGQKLALSDEVIATIAHEPKRSTLDIASRGVVSRLLRQAALPLRLADRARSALATLQMATLLEHYARHHHRGPDLDETSAQALRDAMDQAVAAAPSLLQALRAPTAYADALRAKFDGLWKRERVS